MFAQRLRGKTALVTGAAKRLGRAIALELSRLGVNVVVHYSESESAAKECVEQIRSNGVEGYALQGDLQDYAGSERILHAALELAGPLDFLINNASNYLESTLESVDADNLSTSMAVNAYSPLFISRAFAAQQRESSIVNLLDTRIYSYDREHIAYSLSKKALFALTKMLAYEYAPQVRVNAVAPGLILPPEGEGVEWLENLKKTNPLQRYGSVGDVSEAVVFLLASDFITGEVIRVDGGRHLKNSFYG